MKWHIAKRRKTLEKLVDGWQKDLVQAYEKLKAQVRARVEHPFHIVKNIFKHKKARYRGLANNNAQLNVLFALSNLYMVRGQLRPSGRSGAKCAGNGLGRGLKCEKRAGLRKASRKFDVTRTKNSRYASEPAELDLFCVSLIS
jgi:hypothetical protein